MTPDRTTGLAFLFSDASPVRPYKCGDVYVSYAKDDDEEDEELLLLPRFAPPALRSLEATERIDVDVEVGPPRLGRAVCET